MKVRVGRDATKELEEAAAWYERENPGLGYRLLNVFENAVKLLKEPNPPLTLLTGEAAKLGAKDSCFINFPFLS